MIVQRNSYQISQENKTVPSPQEKLANALQALEQLQAKGKVALRTSDLETTDRELLARNGFLQVVMKGWYIPALPDQPTGESTAWYASFWAFCADYLSERFGDEWCISPEQSLLLHVGNKVVPRQLIVRSPHAKNNTTELPHKLSILDIQLPMPAKGQMQRIDGINTYSLTASLLFCSSTLFRQNPIDARAALSTIADASELLSLILEGGHSSYAGRLAGALRNIGRKKIADDILTTMKLAGYACREKDPFEAPAPITLSRHERSPYVSRINGMCQAL